MFLVLHYSYSPDEEFAYLADYLYSIPVSHACAFSLRNLERISPSCAIVFPQCHLYFLCLLLFPSTGFLGVFHFVKSDEINQTYSSSATQTAIYIAASMQISTTNYSSCLAYLGSFAKLDRKPAACTISDYHHS